VPPTTLAVSEIRGRALRTYRVRDLAEVDANLRRLRRWLAGSIARSPSLTRRHIDRYLADADLLLDARLKIMQAEQAALDEMVAA
jgi:hypothetical protein